MLQSSTYTQASRQVWELGCAITTTGWEVVPGQGLKPAGKGARSNVIFAEDDVAENSKIEDYVTNQREVIARLLPGPHISDTGPTRMPKAGDALGLEITFRSPTGETGHQRQFYVCRGKADLGICDHHNRRCRNGACPAGFR